MLQPGVGGRPAVGSAYLLRCSLRVSWPFLSPASAQQVDYVALGEFLRGGDRNVSGVSRHVLCQPFAPRTAA